MPRTVAIAVLLVAAFGSRVANADGDTAAIPPAADRPADFHKDILPILSNSCTKCHANAQQKGGFSIDTREALLKGGDSGAAVVVGKSGESRLVKLIAGLEPDSVMPAQGPRLTAVQIGLVRAWIDQGLTWEKGFTFRKSEPAALRPRRPPIPAVPAGSNLINPVDLLLAPYFASRRIAPGEVVADRVFLRRVSLDLVGLLPAPEEISAFVADSRADKRERLVERLLADNGAYAEHWLTFWNDALRNDYRGTGYIDGGRVQITDWLYGALADNLPYDRFVRELISPGPASQGFVKGIVWRGVVNASQVPPVQAAQNISQVFLGINLKCASCHDSFINDWKLVDAYGLASVFSDEPLQIHRCDRPTGQFAPMKFLYPELGRIDPEAPPALRQAELADAVTNPQNGRLTRTIVNRIWARFLGRGLVEPVDDMDSPPWSADLLDYLAVDLVEHGYDLKRTMARIVTSRAYQLPAVPMQEQDRDAFLFRGPAVRRMTGEQFVDAVSAITGIAYAEPAVKIAAAPTAKSAADAASDPKLAAGAAKPSANSAPQSHRIGARAALVNADPLLVALGRSNREQVVTERPKLATTLEALELTNGKTLSSLLRRGAARWLAEGPKSTDELVVRLFEQSLGRRPTETELRESAALVGSPPSAEGMEDLLWSVIMLPEFQLIY